MLPWSVTPPPENDHGPSGGLEAADELGGGAGGRFPSFHFPARRAPHDLTPSFLFHKQRWERSFLKDNLQIIEESMFCSLLKIVSAS